MLNPPCSPCSTHRAQHRWEPVPAAPLPGALGWGGSHWPGGVGGQGGPGLTGAAEALLADPQQHGAAEVAVGRFLEVLQPPGVLPIVLHILQGRRAEGRGRFPTDGPSPPVLSAFHLVKAPSMSAGVRSQQDHGLPLLLFSPVSLGHPCCRVSPHPPGIFGSGHSWHRAPAPHNPSVQTGYRDALLVANTEEVSPHLGPGHRHHGVTKASLLHLGPGTSTSQKPLKIPCFLESSTPSPTGCKHHNGHWGTKTQISSANYYSMASTNQSSEG